MLGFSQSEKELLSQLEDARHDSDRAKIYLGLHDAVFKTDIPKTKVYGEKIVEYARKFGSLQYELIGYKKLAAWGRRDRNYDQTLHYDTLWLLMAKQINTPEALHAAHMQIATDYIDASRYAPALYHLNACLSLTLTKNNDSARAKVENRLGYYYLDLHQYTKALPHFEHAIADYQKMGDVKMVAHSKRGFADALLAVGRTEKVPEILFDAINYFRETKGFYNQAHCLVILSKAHLANGSFQVALKDYLDAKKIFAENNYRPEEGMAASDIASFYLTAQDFKNAKKYGLEAQKILQTKGVMQGNGIEQGLIPLMVFWGQYHSMSGNLDSSDYYFTKADRMAKAAALDDWITENLRYWAVLKYKKSDKRAGDSLLLKYTERIIQERDPAAIASDTKEYIRANHITDTGIINSLKKIYTPGGLQELKDILAGKKNSGSMNMDSMLTSGYNIIPYTADSARELASYDKILELEQQYKTQIISDSLQLQKQQVLLTRSEVKQKNITLVATVALLLLVATGLYLQYRSRRRAEQDKARIELLQNEIHHRVKNNLAVINRLVDVAGKKGVEDVPLAALKTRIKSIELLHTHLYSQEATVGNIALQPYLEDLCLAIAATFHTDRNIALQVNTPAEVNSAIAEKLGLIINELVTNSYKYAFENREAGRVQITAHRHNGTLTVQIADDGVGLPETQTGSSYGMKLIKGLSHELKGRFAFHNSNGTRFEIAIPV